MKRRRYPSSLGFFCSFVKPIEGVEAVDSDIPVDVSGILTKECFEAWKKKRTKLPADPVSCFKKTLQAHCRGSDKRSPFPPMIEKALLVELRKPFAFAFLERIGGGISGRPSHSGIRSLGYHESRELKRNQEEKVNSGKQRDAKELMLSQAEIQSNSESFREISVQKFNSSNTLKRPIQDDSCRSLDDCGGLSDQAIGLLDEIADILSEENGRKKKIARQLSLQYGAFSLHLGRNLSALSFNLDDVDDLFGSCNGAVSDTSISNLDSVWESGEIAVLEGFHDVTVCEQEQVAELKRMLQPTFKEFFQNTPPPADVVGDVKLLRFLRNTDYDVEDAHDRVRKNLEWRKVHKLDTVRRNLIEKNVSFETLLKELCITCIGGYHPFYSVDNFANPVHITSLGKGMNVKGLTAEEFERDFIVFAEFRSLFFDKISRTEKRVAMNTVVLDLKHVTLSSARKLAPFYHFVLNLSQEQYPEQCGCVHVVGNSRWLSGLWRMYKSWIHTRNRKLVVVRTMAEFQHQQFNEMKRPQFTKEQLPHWIGGTATTSSCTGLAKLRLTELCC